MLRIRPAIPPRHSPARPPRDKQSRDHRRARLANDCGRIRRPARHHSGAPSRPTCRIYRRHGRKPWPALARPQRPPVLLQAPTLFVLPRDAMRRAMAA
jgi:hypothetical protein